MNKLILAMLAVSLNTFAQAETLYPQEMKSCKKTYSLNLTSNLVGSFENGADKVVIDPNGVTEISTSLFGARSVDADYCLKQSANKRGVLKMQFKSTESLGDYHKVQKVKLSLNSQDQLVVKSCWKVKNVFLASHLEMLKKGESSYGMSPCYLVETILNRVN
jgi:hypothetical protein